MGETKGSAKKGVGWLTGDRQVEAEGRVEEQTGEPPNDDAVVEDVKEQVKAAHGDYGVEETPQ
jgi:uncharacterized protein YjbJ (UPF0337 family)